MPVGGPLSLLYMSESDMLRAGVADMARCMDTIEEAFVLLEAGDYRMAGLDGNSHGAKISFPTDSPFPAMPKPTPDRRFMAMPAYLGGAFGTTGVKWYGSNIANRDKGLPRSILLFVLSDTDTGAPLAVMSANLLSAYRTGAVMGVGARHLARPDSTVVGLHGPGVMARTALHAFTVACPGIDTVKVQARGQESLDAFRRYVETELPSITTVDVVHSLEEVVRESDIVTYTASVASGDPGKYPIVRRDWVSPGTFLAMPGPCNIDNAMAGPEVCKVVDNYQMYRSWSDELPKPAHRYVPLLGCKLMDLIDEGQISEGDIQSLGRIVTRGLVRRADDVFLLCVGGMPIEDVAWATVLWRNAIAEGIGVNLDLWESPALR